MDDSNDSPRPGRPRRPSAELRHKTMKLRRLHVAPRAVIVSSELEGRAPRPTPVATYRRRLFGAPDLTGMRVLTVEADEELAVQLSMRFASCGAVVSSARTCAEATLTLVAGRWDLLIADIGLPDGNGYSLARIARALPLPPTCIALSKLGSHDDIDEARRAGFRLHVRKPCDASVLIHIAERLRIHTME